MILNDKGQKKKKKKKKKVFISVRGVNKDIINRENVYRQFLMEEIGKSDLSFTEISVEVLIILH